MTKREIEKRRKWLREVASVLTHDKPHRAASYRAALNAIDEICPKSGTTLPKSGTKP